MDVLLAVPSLLSVILCCMVIGIHIRFKVCKTDLGDMVDLQCTACVAALISALGSCIGTFGDYSSSSNDNVACVTEAVFSSFGELAVIIISTATCLYVYRLIVGPSVTSILTSTDKRKRYAVILLLFGFCTLMTLVPLGLGQLGMNSDPTGRETWCWFRPGQFGWEVAQFYAPLLVALGISAITFVHTTLILCNQQHIRTRVFEWMPESVYTRLLLQHLVLYLVYLPDLCVVMMDDFQRNGTDYGGSRLAEFMWKAEGIAFSLLYLCNRRVIDALFPSARSVPALPLPALRHWPVASRTRDVPLPSAVTPPTTTDAGATSYGPTIGISISPAPVTFDDSAVTPASLLHAMDPSSLSSLTSDSMIRPGPVLPPVQPFHTSS